MRTLRGFRLGRKIVKFWRWDLLKPKKKPNTRGYLRLDSFNGRENKTMTKICNWGRCITKKLCCSNRKTSTDALLDQTPFDRKPVAVPKGHLAVYVGQKDDDTHRYLVPVIYFNHPLFGELLREAEQEYGFHHPGGITIPCRVSEFESVQTKIAGETGRKLTRRFRLPDSLVTSHFSVS